MNSLRHRMVGGGSGWRGFSRRRHGGFSASATVTRALGFGGQECWPFYVSQHTKRCGAPHRLPGKLRLLVPSDISELEAEREKIRVRFAAGLEPLLVDRMVYALGGTTPENFLKAIGIAFDGPAPRLTEGFGTSLPGLFLAGDLTAGKRGGSIILAFNTAAAAMRQICHESGICALDLL